MRVNSVSQTRKPGSTIREIHAVDGIAFALIQVSALALAPDPPLS